MTKGGLASGLLLSLLVHGGVLYGIGFFEADTARAPGAGLRVSLQRVSASADTRSPAVAVESEDPADSTARVTEVARDSFRPPRTLLTARAGERAVAAAVAGAAPNAVAAEKALEREVAVATAPVLPVSQLTSSSAMAASTPPASAATASAQLAVATVAPQSDEAGRSSALTAETGEAEREQASVGDQLLAALQRHFAYPLRARRKGWEGEVLLGVDLDEQGSIAAVRVLASSGYGTLDRAAIASMQAVGALERTLSSRLSIEIPVHYRLIN